MRHGEMPRNSTTFFGAATGDLPFGKDYGLRKECACIFNTTNNPKSLVAVLAATADFRRIHVSPKNFAFSAEKHRGQNLR